MSGQIYFSGGCEDSIDMYRLSRNKSGKAWFYTKVLSVFTCIIFNSKIDIINLEVYNRNELV